LIYDKENLNNPLSIPVNKGNEASVYLEQRVFYTFEDLKPHLFIQYK
jgi:hypothetical protein